MSLKSSKSCTATTRRWSNITGFWYGTRYWAGIRKGSDDATSTTGAICNIITMSTFGLVSGPESSLIQMMNLKCSVRPNVLLLVPVVVVVVVALPPVLVFGLFIFLLPVLFFVVTVLFFFTANVEAVILPAVTSAIDVTITKIADSVVFVRIMTSILHSYRRFCLVLDWRDQVLQTLYTILIIVKAICSRKHQQHSQ